MYQGLTSENLCLAMASKDGDMRRSGGEGGGRGAGGEALCATCATCLGTPCSCAVGTIQKDEKAASKSRPRASSSWTSKLCAGTLVRVVRSYGGRPLQGRAVRLGCVVSFCKVCPYVYMYICIYIHIYTYIHTYRFNISYKLDRFK
jgi:hypothetical protein